MKEEGGRKRTSNDKRTVVINSEIEKRPFNICCTRSEIPLLIADNNHVHVFIVIIILINKQSIKIVKGLICHK